jgi:hypothetical protein
MMKRITSEGFVMTLTLPSYAGLILLLLARLDASIHDNDSFHGSLTVLLYLGLVTSLIALGLVIKQRRNLTTNAKICFALNLSWFLYSALMLPAIWIFPKH